MTERTELVHLLLGVARERGVNGQHTAAWLRRVAVAISGASDQHWSPRALPGIIACDQAEVDEKLAPYKGEQEPTIILTGVPRAVKPIASSRLS
jgi:hypothetical protein